MKRATLLGLGLLPAAVLADDVYLRGGGKVTGTVVERSESRIVIEAGPGLVTLPASRVERVVTGHDALAEYRERARTLDPEDASAWLSLAAWARDRGLETQARAAFERVVAIDPGNARAQKALGNVQHEQQWMSPEESYRARGYILFEGRWITSYELDVALREQAADRARLEAEARVREAEARAHEAEARALAMAREMASESSYPVYPGYIVAWPFVPRPFCHVRRSAPPTRPPSRRPMQGGIGDGARDHRRHGSSK